MDDNTPLVQHSYSPSSLIDLQTHHLPLCLHVSEKLTNHLCVRVRAGTETNFVAVRYAHKTVAPRLFLVRDIG